VYLSLVRLFVMLLNPLVDGFIWPERYSCGNLTPLALGVIPTGRSLRTGPYGYGGNPGVVRMEGVPGGSELQELFRVIFLYKQRQDGKGGERK
jgi:hypothetical protein